MEMNPITQPVPTRAKYWMLFGPEGTAEILRSDFLKTTWSVAIYKTTATGSIEEVDFEEFDDALLAEQWAAEQI